MKKIILVILLLLSVAFIGAMKIYKTPYESQLAVQQLSDDFELNALSRGIIKNDVMSNAGYLILVFLVGGCVYIGYSKFKDGRSKNEKN